MPNHNSADSRNFTIFRHTVYALAIFGYLLYLVYLAYQLATDDPLLNIKQNFIDAIDVPIMDICSRGYFEILRCDTELNNSTHIRDDCKKYVSNIIHGDHISRKYCRTFKAETIKYAREKPDGVKKFKFCFKINSTEAEVESLGIALLTINFLSPDFEPLLKMDQAVQLRLQLQGNFIPAIVGRVALIKFRVKIYKSILPWDFRAIVGFTPDYHPTPSIECQVNSFPFVQNPYDVPPGTNGYFSVHPGDFVMEETTEKRTTTILNTFASAGGAFGIVCAILIFLFGSSRLDTWGFARRVAACRDFAQMRQNLRPQRRIIDLEKYLVPSPYND